MDGFVRRAGELELPAWLERDRAAVAMQRDHVAFCVLPIGLPAEALLQRSEHAAHAAIPALERERFAARREHPELLGLGPDAELALGLTRLVKRPE
jgi:hypothetical protein